MKKMLIVMAAAAALCGGLFAQSVDESDFGTTKSGVEVKRITLKNKSGMKVELTNFGAAILGISVPDREGKFADVALGFDKLSDYEKPIDYIGALVGRYGNRIAGGKFFLDGQEYNLTKNDGTNCLHGGKEGFDKRVWSVETSKEGDSVSATFKLTSPDGDQGFPGKLDVVVTYTLNNENELSIDYSAKTDKTTVCNLTQHCYFNLAGAGNGNILGHELTINADKFTPVNSVLIPTGRLKDVEDTPFDFRKNIPIGARIFDRDSQLKIGGGYDHNFVLNKAKGKESDMSFAARVYDPISGRQMEIYTTEPGIQFYSGCQLKGDMIGKGGKAYRAFYGLALETQHFPNSPNEKSFPSVVLTPDKEYKTKTVLKFSAQ